MNRLKSHLLLAVSALSLPYYASLLASPIIDLSFAPPLNPGASVTEVLTLEDGPVIIAGAFTAIGGVARNGVARLNTDGSLDVTLDPGAGANGSIRALAQGPDGTFYLGGRFSEFNGTACGGIVRLLGNGTVDAGFTVGAAGGGGVHTIGLAGNRILMAGNFSSLGGTESVYVALLEANGALHGGFVPSLDRSHALEAGIDCLAVQTDGRILVGGNFHAAGAAAHLARLNPDGSLDASFNGDHGPILYPTRILVSQDGSILVAGLASPDNAGFVRRLLPNGQIDPAFQAPALQGMVHDIALQPDGKILVAGSLAQGSPTAALRLLPDGALDPDWQILANGPVLALEITADGKVLAGGAFSEIQGVAQPGLARLVEAGPAFHGTSTANGEFRVMLQAVPGVTYAIEASQDLKTWMSFSTNTATNAGLEVVDPARTQHPFRFFRARLAAAE